MPGVTIAHPTAKHLADFVQGRLTSAQAETISKHLAICLDCVQAVEQIPADSFVDLVRSARPSGTQLPSRQLQDVSPPLPNLDVPAELVNHAKFRIEKELGRGGMGVVYKAENLKLGKTVALKVIARGLSAHPEALKRFQQEVRAAGKLDHPNIVKALDADQAGDLHMLVMDFVDGLDLAVALEKKGPLPVLHACEYVRQAAMGLQHAHEQGMIHRDIKPKNLMLTRKGQVKILDFGLASMTSDKSDRTKLTKLGSFMGTVEYIAPEQAEDATKADIRSDIYSLGCTLYCLLTGQPPFVRDTDVKMILAHLGEEPKPLYTLRADVPKKLSALVAKMLAKEPSQRYQTPVAVAQALREFCKPGARSNAGMAHPGSISSVRPSEKGTVISAETARGTEFKSETPVARPTSARSPDASPFQDLKSESPKPLTAKEPTKPSLKRVVPGKVKWLVGGSIGLVVFLVSLIGLWAAGVFKVKTAEGILVLEVNEANPEVFVDGEKVTVAWSHGGTKAEVLVKPGTPHEVVVKKDGFTVQGQTVTLKEGEKQILSARLDKPPAPRKTPVEEGFVPLFNGKDLTGWKAEGKGQWTVDPNGRLVGQGPEAELVTERGDFKDFALHLELSAAVQTEAFVGIRMHRNPKRQWTAMTSRVFGTDSNVQAGMTRKDFQADEYGIKRLEFKPGESFTLRLTCAGDELWVKTNDTLTAGVKYQANEFPTGPVGLFVAKGQLTVSKIEMREAPRTTFGGTKSLPPLPALDRGPWTSLFNGKDLKGWSLEGPKTTKVSFKDGVMTARNDGPSGYVDHLLSARTDFINFHLRCEVKILNDMQVPFGIQTRVDPSPIVFGGMRGYIAAVSETGADAQGKTTGTALIGLASRVRPSFDLVEDSHDVPLKNTWVKMDVIVVGSRIQMLLNGKVVSECQDDGKTFLRGPCALVFLPGTNCQVRNIEVADLKTQPDQVPGANPRSRWIHKAIVGNEWNERWTLLQHVQGKEWIESGTDHPKFGRYFFTETDRTPDYIELERPEGNGKLILRLYDSYAELGPSQTNLSRWRDGAWQKE